MSPTPAALRGGGGRLASVVGRRSFFARWVRHSRGAPVETTCSLWRERSFVPRSGPLRSSDALEPGCGAAAHPMLPTFGRAPRSPSRMPPRSPAPSRCTSAMWLQRCCITNACALPRYPPTRLQVRLRSLAGQADTAARKALLETLDERVSLSLCPRQPWRGQFTWNLRLRHHNWRQLPLQRTRTVDLTPGPPRPITPRITADWMPAADYYAPVTREEVALHNNRDEKLLDHHLGKSLRHHRVGTPSP